MQEQLNVEMQTTFQREDLIIQHSRFLINNIEKQNEWNPNMIKEHQEGILLGIEENP